ncbi:hypothetical protein C7Y45_02815 [Brevibacillus brevis]|nr:hypothetical protein C7Y45_02815 [Lysinibacillus sp. SDF0063]
MKNVSVFFIKVYATACGQQNGFDRLLYPLSRKNRAVKPFPTEHSFGRKSSKIFLFSLTPPRCLAIIRRNTLF